MKEEVPVATEEADVTAEAPVLSEKAVVGVKEAVLAQEAPIPSEEAPIEETAVLAEKAPSTAAEAPTMEEAALTFTLPLKDTKVSESQDATFECTVSRPNEPALWSKDGEEVTADEHIQIASQDYTHSLMLKDTQKDDEGEYTVKCGDVESRAKLMVEGTHGYWIATLCYVV